MNCSKKSKTSRGTVLEIEREKILLVDNHPVFLKYIADFLKDNGYMVKTANNGLLAINILKTYFPDYILVDLVMPNIDGTTLCRIIRNDSRFEKTPLFVISATAVEDIDHLKTIGANLCIAKGPFPETGENILNAITNTGRVVNFTKKNAIFGPNNLHPRQITKELLSATKHLETILEHISDGIFEISQDGKIVFTNFAAAQCFSSTKEALLGVDFLSLFEPENMKEVSALFEAKETQPKSAILKQEGHSFSIRSISIEPEGGSIILFNDVTEFEKTRDALESANKELEVLARTDSLTNIANRRWFDERLKEEWRRMSREKSDLSLLLFDVDNFKEFNDKHGHIAGDECLKEIARLIAAKSKRPADFAARYGGDEFALILPNTSSHGAKHIAEQLRMEVQELELSCVTSQDSIQISLSIGIGTLKPNEAVSIEQLLTAADNALYEAKSCGRNCISLYKSDSKPIR
ncbi:MAG: diguanylate cyclase [Desulfobacterales bacterium]|nr:diguanylate cyclase [Desulfobacterales bacterium]